MRQSPSSYSKRHRNRMIKKMVSEFLEKIKKCDYAISSQRQQKSLNQSENSIVDVVISECLQIHEISPLQYIQLCTVEVVLIENEQLPSDNYSEESEDFLKFAQEIDNIRFEDLYNSDEIEFRYSSDEDENEDNEDRDNA
ncbi:hypothetical protein TKK_0015447 [Trichogramma kaykai]